MKKGLVIEATSQYKNSLDFVTPLINEHKNYIFHFLGHSMGAVLAELQGIKFIGQGIITGDVISFDSIGSKHIATNLYNHENIKNTPIVIYNLAPNIFNTINLQIVTPFEISENSNDADHILTKFEYFLKQYISNNYKYSIAKSPLKNFKINSLEQFKYMTSHAAIDLADYKALFGDCAHLQWISKKFLQKCEKIVEYIWTEDIFFGKGMKSFKDIGKNIAQSSQENEKYYGKSVPIFTKELEQSLVELLHKVEPKVLDIGAGAGMTVWRELLSGAEVVATDIAYKDAASRAKFETYINNRLEKDIFQKRLDVIAEDIFNSEAFLEHYKSRFDLVNMQNVLHFYCPKDIKLMIDNIYQLLKSNGVAVITTNSLYLRQMYIGQECYEKYYEAINSKKMFPGYLKVSMTAPRDKNIYFDSNKSCEIIQYTESDDLCGFKQTMFEENNSLHLTEVWSDFDVYSLSQLFDKDKFDILSSSYYSLVLGPGKVEDPEISFSVSISVRKKEPLLEYLVEECLVEQNLEHSSNWWE